VDVAMAETAVDVLETKTLERFCGFLCGSMRWRELIRRIIGHRIPFGLHECLIAMKGR